MKMNVLKKVLAGMMIFAVGLSTVYVMPQEAKAETNLASVIYEDVDVDTCKGTIGKKAPTCTKEGYLFAGWYSDEGNTPIKAKDDIAGETVKAKFVAAYLTGVCIQIKANTKESDCGNQDANTTMRIVSAVDSTNYKAVGFNVSGRVAKDDAIKNWDMFKYATDGSNKAESKHVYSKLKVYESENDEIGTEKGPEDFFGAGAEGFLFTAMNLSEIPGTYYAATMVIRPYWITLDGTYVEGTCEFDRVEDAYKGIANISVNLKSTDGIAAGMLQVEVPEGFSYVEPTAPEQEHGCIFKEMTVAQSGNVVKCVGNVDGTLDVSDVNDVFVNLKFKKNSTAGVGESTFKVTVPNNGFCNMSESFVTTVKAGDVRY